MEHNFDWLSTESIVEEQQQRQSEALIPPTRYKVILNNDDYTTMDFVVKVLQRYFDKTLEQATTLMLEVHHQGKAVCGYYTAEIAETKVAQVNSYAREHEYPLLCTLEEA